MHRFFCHVRLQRHWLVVRLFLLRRTWTDSSYPFGLLTSTLYQLHSIATCMKLAWSFHKSWKPKRQLHTSTGLAIYAVLTCFNTLWLSANRFSCWKNLGMGHQMLQSHQHWSRHLGAPMLRVPFPRLEPQPPTSASNHLKSTNQICVSHCFTDRFTNLCPDSDFEPVRKC